MARWMDRWAARAQRKSDARLARWQERQRERTRRGQMTVMDRWAARIQRKSDARLARWQECERFRQLVPSGPVAGPGGSTAVIAVDQAGLWWLHWWRNPVPPTGSAGGALGVLLLVCLLISEAVWWLVFHRAYTIHARTNGHPPMKVSVRLPSEVAAYRAAAQLVSRFQAEGLIALQGWAEQVRNTGGEHATPDALIMHRHMRYASGRGLRGTTMVIKGIPG